MVSRQNCEEIMACPHASDERPSVELVPLTDKSQIICHNLFDKIVSDEKVSFLLAIPCYIGRRYIESLLWSTMDATL